METILIYRDLLLPLSETFIKEQGEGLRNYTPLYIGGRQTNGISIPQERTYIINNNTNIGKMRHFGLKVLRTDFGIAHELRRFNPRLIHAHFGPDGLTILPLAKKLDIPLMVTFHGYDATVSDHFAKKSSSFSHRQYAKNKQILQRSGFLYIAVSNFIKKKMIEAGYESNKIKQHYIGIDLEKFTPCSSIQREPIVLFVGRLVEQKGCSYLIKAMSEVQKIIPEAKLVIIGDGPLRQRLEQEAKNSLIGYQFLGYRSPAAVKEWMNKSKIFCVPSVVDESGAEEGFGMVFAEANAMGLPVVSFSTGGIPEAVVDGSTGLLAKERDVNQLIINILYLLENEEIWHKFSESGCSRVSELFDIRKQTDKLELLYSEVITTNSREMITNGR